MKKKILVFLIMVNILHNYFVRSKRKQAFVFSSLVIITILFVFVSFFAIKEAKAGAEHNVYGWAWAGPTIGWVSFNSTNTGWPTNYGVHLCVDNGDPICATMTGDKIGRLTGYAWMGSTDPSFGWIDFSPAPDLVAFPGCGYPTTPCYTARLDMGDWTFSGWARALSLDSWIKLRGTWIDPVTLNISLSPREFKGWAWGDGGSVLSWISFNCENREVATGKTCLNGNDPAFDPTVNLVDYKVMTDFSASGPPIAAISCDPVSCEVYYGEALQLINNSTDPNGDSDIVKSTWCFKQAGQPDYCPAYGDCSSKCNCTPQSEVGIGSYTAELYVEDTAAQSDTAVKDFRIKRDITAGFMCSLDNSTWQVCEDISPGNGETVHFEDDSLASEGAVINSREWEKDAVAFDSGNNTNPSVAASIPSITIKLTVTDTAGRSASKTHTIGVRMPLPTWKEIPPF